MSKKEDERELEGMFTLLFRVSKALKNSKSPAVSTELLTNKQIEQLLGRKRELSELMHDISCLVSFGLEEIQDSRKKSNRTESIKVAA